MAACTKYDVHFTLLRQLRYKFKFSQHFGDIVP